MQHSIESFVRTLQEDGVAAGKAEAAQLLLEARQQAEVVITEATAEANRILAEAHQKRQELERRQIQELALAARDAVLALQQKLCDTVEKLIDDAAAQALKNPAEVGKLIERVVAAFAAQQATHPDQSIIFKVAGEDAKRVVQDAIAKATVPYAPGVRNVFHVETGLSDLGFEYRQNGSAVEVTPQAVVFLLSPLVSDEVRLRMQSGFEEGHNGKNEGQ